jgi:hypothetical protein
VPGDDLINAEIKLMQLLQRLRILFEIGESEVAKVLL